MIKIRLNGAPREVRAATMAALLAELGHDPGAPVATAVNGVFVARSRRVETRLAAGDEVEVARPMSGG
jgi:sulfur carrier protein